MKGDTERPPDPLGIVSHCRLMRAEYQRTGDPLFLAVPREMLINALAGEDAWKFQWVSRGGFDRDFSGGLRNSGLVFKNVPWFLATLREEGNPRPGGVEVSPVRETVEMAKGEAAPVCFAVKNTSASAVQELRMSFQPRLEFSVDHSPATPASLAPGQSAKLCYELRAPEKINLTLELNRTSYAHWSATFRNQAQPGVAHAWVRIALR
jgi:hypothetical protein